MARRLLAVLVAGAVAVGSDRLGGAGDGSPADLDPPTGSVESAGDAGEGASTEEPISRHGLEPDERAVAIVPPAAPLPLDVGDRVELLAVASRDDGTIRSHVLGPPVRVLSISPDSIVVVVPAELATMVIEYQAGGTIELVATP